MRKSICVALITLSLGGCNQKAVETARSKVQLITLDPGHFHAALVQKSMYDGVDSTVYVYAPAGSDLDLHLDRINSYNNRKEGPTHWKEKVYSGNDFLERMLSDSMGNVVILSGNNRDKSSYVLKSLEGGFHVLADKPLVINADGFEKLKTSFAVAEKNKRLLYDIMTERFEITTILQREFSMMPAVFGVLEKGSLKEPAITKESVHHFYKYVSGSVLTRPAWFMDVNQQGEGMVDVMTHLVDLVQWESFPDQIIDFTKDIQIHAARRWSTTMTLDQFKAITKLDSVPEYLTGIKDKAGALKISCNGEINYQLKGVHAKTSVIWNYQAPEGAGDTHYSIMRGTLANLIIRQGKEQGFKSVLYIESTGRDKNYKSHLTAGLEIIQKKYPGVELKETNAGWEVIIPDKLKEGHEAHFAKVTQNFLDYLNGKAMPAWEIPNMLAKYYTTTQALELAKQKESK